MLLQGTLCEEEFKTDWADLLAWDLESRIRAYLLIQASSFLFMLCMFMRSQESFAYITLLGVIVLVEADFVHPCYSNMAFVLCSFIKGFLQCLDLLTPNCSKIPCIHYSRAVVAQLVPFQYQRTLCSSFSEFFNSSWYLNCLELRITECCL